MKASLFAMIAAIAVNFAPHAQAEGINPGCFHFGPNPGCDLSQNPPSIDTGGFHFGPRTTNVPQPVVKPVRK